MKCLIIKTSSLGDIIHTLPALTDASLALKNIQFDWVVEEAFQEIPTWHPSVRQVIPVAIRRWRKSLFKSLFSDEWRQFKQRLSTEKYDVIIDAQGLLKSAFLTRYTDGIIYGFDKASAKEGLVEHFYDFPQKVDKSMHAVERVRQLFAQSLSYELPQKIDYGIKSYLSENKTIDIPQIVHDKKQIIFFHGTTWATKHWPDSYWQQLAENISQQGFQVLLPWSNDNEKAKVDQIADFVRDKKKNEKQDNIIILEKMSLHQIALLLTSIDACIAVDTGLAHLAAALDIPTISLFGSTSPGLTRPYGQHQQPLQVNYACKACLKKRCELTKTDMNLEKIKPACYTSLTPEYVFNTLLSTLNT